MIALGLAVVVALFWQTLGERSNVIFMFTPFAAVWMILFVITLDGDSQAGWHGLGLLCLGNLRSWGWAFCGPLLGLGFSYTLVWTLEPRPIPPVLADKPLA